MAVEELSQIFVPLDTNGTSAYFSKLIRKGIFNQFSLYYVNKNRKFRKEIFKF